MEASLTITTPETDPTHPVVGRHFVGVCPSCAGTHLYWCDSHDPRRGFRMIRIDLPGERSDGSGGCDCRSCVSEKAIGQTHHVVHPRRKGRATTPFRTIRTRDLVVPRAA